MSETLLTSNAALSTRQVYQVLKDIALGVRVVSASAVRLVQLENVVVDVEGWMLTLHRENGQLVYCAACQAPDGRTGTLQDWHRFGTNPVDLLSQWERAQLEKILTELR